MNDELLGLLGLCKKAGKLLLGEEDTIEATLAHRARLVLMAADAAANTAAKVKRAAGQGNAPCLSTPFTKAQLGAAAGRAACAVLCVTDVGFAAAAVKKLSQSDPEAYGQLAESMGHKADKTARRRREKLARLKAEKKGKPRAMSREATAPPRPAKKTPKAPQR